MPRPLVACLLAAALVVACGDASSDADRTPPPRPHVVLVLVDQLRADSMEEHAPGLMALAERGVRATTMRSVAPWTYPSVLSLFSGLYPQQHGADGEHEGNRLRTFDPELPLLHEILSGEGYATAAFVTNPFFHDWNSFHDGFDTYDIHFIGSQGARRGKARKVWRPSMFADSVNKAVRKHFRDRPLEGPEFTYVHYIDVHGPWDGAPFPGDYASSITWTDGKILELHELFTERYGDDLLFVVTADHGQALDDDEEVGAGPDFRKNKATLHDFNLRIPFVVLPSRHVTTPRVLEEPCSNVDVLPTLLDWLEVEPPLPLPGRSLLPAIRDGAPLPDDRVLYARHSAFGRASDCIVHGQHKSIRFLDPATNETVARHSHDLAGDPRETADLGEDPWGDVALLRKAAGDRGLSFAPVTTELEDDVTSDLKALGYLK